MLLLVSGATATVRRHKDNPFLGQLHVPRQRGFHFITSSWACDNDAFKSFDETRFLDMLAKLVGEPGCLFVPCPDVVAKGKETLVKFDEWFPRLRKMDYPVALVAQDGMDRMCLPWREIDALFIGGSDEFKESSGTAELVHTAKRFRKWVHMGRVNSMRRFRMAHEWGCDSVDGGQFSKWPDTHIPKFLRWLSALSQQRLLYHAHLPV